MDTLIDVYLKYTVISAGVGAVVSGIDRLAEMSDEAPPVYKYPFVERPIQFVYKTSRLAGSIGLGASIAGVTALTAPISIPAYMFWKKYYSNTTNTTNTTTTNTTTNTNKNK